MPAAEVERDVWHARHERLLRVRVKSRNPARLMRARARSPSGSSRAAAVRRAIPQPVASFWPDRRPPPEIA